MFAPTMCAMAFSGHLANAATELMKLDHEEPQLTEPYLSKQKKLMVSVFFFLMRKHVYDLPVYTCWEWFIISYD